MEPHFTLSDLHLEIRASIGIVLYPEHGNDSDTLMRRADMTMSTAKKSDLGYTFYDSKFDFYSPRRLMLLGELRQAINHGDLCLYFQPKIKIATGQVIGMEGLIRWKHPRHGLIFPDEFIPLAERSGLIKPLSLWVLREAPRRWAEWNREGLSVNVSVNLSVRDLFDVTLPDQIKEILKRHEMPADKLLLEITESTIMEDPNQVRGILQNLSGMGVRIAIDDFGTGYSSLAYLKNLPVDEIKIDKSFVLEMDKDNDDATIVRSTIELGHTLGLSVVAEGVERAEAWEMLQSLGCDAAQGYYMERPLAPENVIGWLKESSWGLKRSNAIG
jgi:EAL domain-containing protein (putative c-di-GMP-specific phosphodiesterase class I)